MDSWITIGTKLDSKQLERDLINEKKRLERFEKDAEKLATAKTKAELDLEDYYKQKELIEESTSNTLKKAQTEEQVNEILGMEQQSLQSLDEAYSKELNSLNNINNKIEENAHQQQLVNDNIRKMSGELTKVKGFQNINESIKDIGSSMQKAIKKVSRWALAIFSIRSAYMAVRNAINYIASDDEQLQADLDYIKAGLAYAIEPIVRGIVSLVKQLMFYIGYIIKQWTGKNIFANANKHLDSANKNAKKLQKTLAGFDEMNVLSDTSGGTSGATPSIDFKDIDNMEAPKWLDTIVTVGQWVLDNWQDVVGLLLLTKLFFDLITGNWAGVIIDIILFLITQLPRLWDAIKVVWDSLVEFGKWLWDGITYIFTHIEEILGNIGNAIGVAIQFVVNLFAGAIQGIIDGFVYVGNVIKNVFNGVVNFFKSIVSTIINLFKDIGTKVGNVIGSAFKAVINGVLKAIESILNTPIKTINSLIKEINKVPGINLGKLTTFKLPRLAKGGIVNMPSSGVPVGSAIAGERGQEGVIPLTDSQQMALLGEAIGKYITVDITNITQLDGRQIARKVDKINQNNNFVLNR